MDLTTSIRLTIFLTTSIRLTSAFDHLEEHSGPSEVDIEDEGVGVEQPVERARLHHHVLLPPRPLPAHAR